ncbi:MAG TPA: acyl-CoA dehydrogenase family protein, partial [Solirubrobacteraceae bacterium]|nr:acyl-CoA dehydrogenase family protein [Solirubrobacteraceae bacterium]
MDFELTDEQRLVSQTAREFTDREIVPVAGRNSREHRFDTDLVAKLAAQGYLGAIVPPRYGGAGLDYVTYGLVCEQIGRGCSGMRTVVSVQTSLVCSAILRWGTEEQKRRQLPPLCSGEALGCFALTEPDTGSDAANLRTRAVRRDDGSWLINGSKMWISMGNHAALALVFAQTDPALAHKGLACFLVDARQPGFRPTEIRG